VNQAKKVSPQHEDRHTEQETVEELAIEALHYITCRLNELLKGRMLEFHWGYRRCKLRNDDLLSENDPYTGILKG
jgi:hypothetical protein